MVPPVEVTVRVRRAPPPVLRAAVYTWDGAGDVTFLERLRGVTLMGLSPEHFAEQAKSQFEPSLRTPGPTRANASSVLAKWYDEHRAVGLLREPA